MTSLVTSTMWSTIVSSTRSSPPFWFAKAVSIFTAVQSSRFVRSHIAGLHSQLHSPRRSMLACELCISAVPVSATKSVFSGKEVTKRSLKLGLSMSLSIGASENRSHCPPGPDRRLAFGRSTELFVGPVGKTQSPRRCRRMATAISGRFELSAPD